MSELTRIADIADSVYQERLRQNKLWGLEFDKMNTANDWSAFISAYLGKATYVGRNEEFSWESFRENMKKVSALAQAAILMVDMYGACAPRHYENLPKGGAKS